MPPAPETAVWTSLGPSADFAAGSLTAVRRDGRRLVVARTEDGAIHVLDGRCPHEGYPLAQGTLSGCALTCCWHNWKFDVRDGSCLLGGEGVRRFPSREQDGEVLYDPTEPAPEEFFDGWLASLREGMSRHDLGRAIRDGVRLLHGGYPARRLLLDVALDDARRAEYGTTHVLPVCADLARIAERMPGASAMVAVAPAVELCGETNRGLPERARPEPLAGATRESLRAAVESEDVARAEALLLGAFDAGVPSATLLSWVRSCLADHFLGFGHPLIYLEKLADLAAETERDVLRELLASLLVSSVLETREDTLPYLSAHAEFLRAVEPELPALYAAADPSAPLDEAALRDAILDAKGPRACEALHAALRAGVAPARLADVLVGAAAHRLLRFDVAHDTNPEVAETWLWATHRLTFASAARSAIARHPEPDALRFLFQVVAFVNSGKAMDGAPVALPSPADAAPADVVAAIEAGDVDAALARTRGVLASTEDLGPLRAALEDHVLGDHAVRPIVVAHRIKTIVCGLDETSRLATVNRAVPLLAAVRFLASPVRERRVGALVAASIAWVAEGRMPHKLTQ